MKQLKKLAALVLAVTMAAAAAVPAWATGTSNSTADSKPESDKSISATVDPQGTIYISNYDAQYSQETLIYKDGNKKQQAYAEKVILTVVDSRLTSAPATKATENTIKASDIKVQINGRNFVLSTAEDKDKNSLKDNKPEIKDFEQKDGKLTYKIELNYLQYNGSGDKATDDNVLRLDVSYESVNLPLATIEQKLSRFVTQTETTPPAPEPTPEPTPTPDPTYRTPSLIVRSTSIGGSSVDAGDDFTLSLEIYATSSGTEALCDVLVSISTADGVTLSNGSTTKYIGDMAPGTSQTVTYPMHAQNSFTGGTSSVSVSLSANGKTTGGGAQATGTTVTVPIIQPERFEISNMEIPETMVVGEENYGSITFVNKGKNELSNMTVTIAGSNLQEPEQSNYVGNLAAGTEQSVDINLCALQAGTVEGTITIVYEDTSGQEVSVTRNFSAAVEDAPTWDDPGMIDPGMQDMPEETKPGLPVWGWALIAAAVAALGFAGFKVAKKRKAAKSQEENDADF